jgi:hypothetical protein
MRRAIQELMDVAATIRVFRRALLTRTTDFSTILSGSAIALRLMLSPRMLGRDGKLGCGSRASKPKDRPKAAS